MDYNVMSLASWWKDGVSEHDTKWNLEDVGLGRSGAIASMAMRAMRHAEWLGEVMLEEILDGRADPEQPYLIRNEETGLYLWFCIVREDREPPVVTDRR